MHRVVPITERPSCGTTLPEEQMRFLGRRWLVATVLSAALAAPITVAHAQTGKLTGVVTDAETGKPIEGVQSLGSIGLKRYLPGTDSLETMDGREVPLDRFMLDIDEHYAHGYLFQNFLTPHPAIYAVCGDRPATVRIGRDGCAGP